MIDVKEWFPLLRGRTGVEVITLKLPVIIRMYNNSGRQLLKHRVKVKCRKKVFPEKAIDVGTKSVQIPYDDDSLYEVTVTRITLTVDYPLIDGLEVELPDCDTFELGRSGTITLEPQEGQLLRIT
jgi:hypothetical protein